MDSDTFDKVNDEVEDDLNYDYDNDTIFALSSGSSMGQATAVAVVRISGPQAASILQSLASSQPLPKPRMAALRNLNHPITDQPLDQALVLWFPGPNSFTGQDLVELHLHGSRAVVESVLKALGEWKPRFISQSIHDSTTRDAPHIQLHSKNIIRLAEPGEFTKRAWQSGKLNLLQVEALADLLVADTKTQQVQALQQLKQSRESNAFEQWRSQLIGGLAHAEAVIDFGDDEMLGDPLIVVGRVFSSPTVSAVAVNSSPCYNSEAVATASPDKTVQEFVYRIW
jgi:tRNA modification GTPase